MKNEITNSLKPPLTKRLSEVGYWKLNEIPGSGECLRQKNQLLDFWGKTIWGNYGKRPKPKWERWVSNRRNHISKKGFTLNAYICVGGWKNWLYDTYVLNAWPQQKLWNIFCALVWPSILEHHRQSPSSIFESPQKTGISFSLKKFLHKCLFKIPLWREIDTAISYFSISIKNLKWKQDFHTNKF